MAEISKEKSKKLDLAWAAGFIDGEGCICLAKCSTGRDRYWLILDVCQFDPFPLGRLKKMFGGELNKKKTGYWGWHVTGKKAATILRTLMKYLYNKKVEAEMAVFWSDLPWRGSGPRTKGGEWRGRTDSQMTMDGKIARSIKACKSRNRNFSFGSINEMVDWALTNPEVMNYGE